MIPKIIHYCWLSNDPFPEDIQKCIDSWKMNLPDYEIIKWDFNRFPKNKSLWVSQAYDSKKYAFAADYIRLYAVYHFGGIYLDTDVEVLKSFDDLLELPYFLGKENSASGIEAAVFGAEKENKWVKDCLDYYEGRQFLLGIGKYDIKVLPSIMRNCIEEKYALKEIESKEGFDYNDNVVCLFPVDWFSPKQWRTGILDTTDKTMAIHHFKGSWKKNVKATEKIRSFIRNFMIRCHLYN